MIVILLISICDDMYRSAYTSVMIVGVNLTVFFLILFCVLLCDYLFKLVN